MSAAAQPIWPQPIEVIGASGETGTGKTFFGLGISDPKDILVLDEEGSASIYQPALGFKHVHIPTEVMRATKKNSFKPIDMYLWFRDYIAKIGQRQYPVIVYDIFSLIDAGITDWVESNPSHFGHTAEQYKKMSGIMWGDHKELLRIMLSEIGTKCETFYFTTHMGAEFKGGQATGKRKAKGKETMMQLASLYLIFERKADSKGNYPNDGKPSALVGKTRLTSGLHYDAATRELVARPALPPRLPVATPNEIRRYLNTPANMGNLAEDEKVKLDTLTDDERLELQAVIAASAAEKASADALRSRLEAEKQAKREAALAARKVSLPAMESVQQTEHPDTVASTTTPNAPAVASAQAAAAVESKPTPTTPKTPPESPPAPKDQSAELKPTRGMSHGQKQRLAQLRDLILSTKGIDPDTQPDEARAAWTDALSPFGVTTAKDLPNSSIPKLIDYLEKKWDAFPTQQPA